MSAEHSDDRRPLGWLLASVGMLSVSTDSLWVRVSEAGALDVAFGVSCCALVVHSTFGRWFDRRPALESLRTHRLPLMGVGAIASVSQLAFITAITETRVANVVAIVASAPLMASLCARVVLGERITRRVAVAITLTMVGIGVIVSNSVGEPTLRGDLLALAAVVCFAVNMTVWRRFPDLSRRAALFLSAAIVVVVTSFAASPFSLDARACLAIAAMGLCFNPLGRLANSNALRYAPVSEVSLFAPTETVAGTVWAALFLSELPGAGTVAGAAVVLAGVFYGTVAAGRSRRERPGAGRMIRRLAP
ncbi:MAG: DMT family transporter [Acidimicrobiaceae bacterium]|nr:DMT family transporter [Acidimicrobiaceae bacterium]MYE96768.1 DMT family transporter [Acidimicrobiaceae bacterium]MYH42887.1 DMT family transporter [Acidimicrobiaceae bacterium]MYI54369.1 DMT family transporter [Acidimicrobiaceae bacterium]MYJ80953.1 DMT family transporter [Acidimicrobiaceae bacterium]